MFFDTLLQRSDYQFFLSRDAYATHMSVRSSVTRQHCVETAELIVKQSTPVMQREFFNAKDLHANPVQSPKRGRRIHAI